LGAFLKARREQVTPADVGIPAGSRRRVPGLRAEEVALLAGISPDYYLRLEQGRSRHPSVEVLGCLASALLLDRDATAYLRALAQAGVGLSVLGPSEGSSELEDFGRLLQSWSGVAAYVQDAHFYNVMANDLAVALCPFFAVGESPIRATFLEPSKRSFFRDWHAWTEEVVPYLRGASGADTGDEGLRALLSELNDGSERFRLLWAPHDVHVRTSGHIAVVHPRVGDLDLRYERFVSATSGLSLMTYFAPFGSASEASLQKLPASA
jgi:transcriptional regulator with XRE-family HTH domain